MFTGTQCWKLTNVFDRNRLSQSDSLADPHRKDLLNFFQTTAFQIEHTFYIGNIIVIASHYGLYIVGIQNVSVVIPF